MTVLDTSAVIEYLVRDPFDSRIGDLLREDVAAAPDVLVFETVVALRRMTLRDQIEAQRATVAVENLGLIRIALFPSMPLRARAWALRRNLAAGDALFVALAERLGEPLMTKDRGMAAAARQQARVETIVLGE